MDRPTGFSASTAALALRHRSRTARRLLRWSVILGLLAAAAIAAVLTPPDDIFEETPTITPQPGGVSLGDDDGEGESTSTKKAGKGKAKSDEAKK